MDWIDFLTSHHIPFVTRGPNTPKNELSIRCPWCGAADPSQHLAINPDGKGWRCLRNRDHKGRSPIRLIQALLHCSYDQARVIAGIDRALVGDFYSQVLNQIQTEKPQNPSHKLQLPTTFKPLSDILPSCRPYMHYLRGRHYQQPTDLNQFNLRYCTTGPFHHRIIFPLYYQKRLITWTGRSILSSEMIRYKTLTTKIDKAKDEGVPLALGAIGHYLLWFDELMQDRGKVLCLTEGPFDALRINYLGKRIGIRATCFFTNSPSAQQIELLHELVPRFEHCLLILDRDAVVVTLRQLSNLTSLHIATRQLPPGLKDPAEISTLDQLTGIIGLDFNKQEG